jgi:hypothetical protein
MPKLHLRFKNIRPEVLDAARALFDANPHQLDSVMQEAAAGTFITRVCNAYNVPTPEVRVEEMVHRWDGTYEYLPAEAIMVDGSPESMRAAQVIIRKFSVLNLFGIARTHLLNHEAVTPKADEPWAWACSLFYAVKPVRFRKLVREGKIRKGMSPADTYSRATFARMVAAGVAEEDGNVLVENFDPRTLDAIESGEMDVRTILPRSATPSALSDWSWDEDDDDEVIDLLSEDSEAPAGEEGPFEVTEASLLGALDEALSEHEAVGEAIAAGAEMHAQVAGMTIEDEIEEIQSADDGLDSLGIVALRGLIRGRVPGGYSLSKPELIAALRAQGINSNGEVQR